MDDHILPVDDLSPKARLEREQAAWDAQRRGFEELLEHQEMQMDSAAAVMRRQREELHKLRLRRPRTWLTRSKMAQRLRQQVVDAELRAEELLLALQALQDGAKAPGLGLRETDNPYRAEPESLRAQSWHLGYTNGLTAVQLGLALDALVSITGKPEALVLRVLDENLQGWLDHQRKVSQTNAA